MTFLKELKPGTVIRTNFEFNHCHNEIPDIQDPYSSDPNIFSIKKKSYFLFEEIVVIKSFIFIKFIDFESCKAFYSFWADTYDKKYIEECSTNVFDII